MGLKSVFMARVNWLVFFCKQIKNQFLIRSLGIQHGFRDFLFQILCIRNQTTSLGTNIWKLLILLSGIPSFIK